jgi:tetratricopeptide (TPR) repeat protein
VKEAEKLWRKAVAKDPNEPMLLYNLGLAARRLGNLDEAARRFRDTIRQAPTHVEARLALASVHMDTGRFAAAERELSEFVANVDRAIHEHGTEALKPLQARARNMMGYALYRLGRYSAAIEVFDMALEDAGENAERRGQILGDRSLSLAALGHYDEAIAEAGRALELAPTSATLNHTLGYVLYFSGRPSDAIPMIEKALQLDPAFGQAYGTLALARAAAGQTEQAVGILEKVLERNPLDHEAILQLSNLHIQAGHFEQASRVLEPYLRAVSGDARAMNNQGLALLGLKRFDDARRILKKAAKVSPDEPFVQTNYGRALMGLGRAAEARPHHEQALRALPDDSRLLAHYGICLAALGEVDRARETLDAALAADPNNEEALLARAGLDA